MAPAFHFLPPASPFLLNLLPLAMDYVRCIPKLPNGLSMLLLIVLFMLLDTSPTPSWYSPLAGIFYETTVLCSYVFVHS